MLCFVVVIVLATHIIPAEARFLDNTETASETVLFNLNDPSGQRSQALASFLSSNSNVDSELSQILSALSSSSSSSTSSGTSMDTTQMVRELRRLVQEKTRKEILRSRFTSLRQQN